MDPEYPEPDPRRRGYPGHHHGYQGYAPQQPVRRTEFGWASVIVSGVALLVGWIPIAGYFVMSAAAVLVLAGLLGRHERTRIPACFGLGLLVVATVVHLAVHVGLG